MFSQVYLGQDNIPCLTILSSYRSDKIVLHPSILFLLKVFFPLKFQWTFLLKDNIKINIKSVIMCVFSNQSSPKSLLLMAIDENILLNQSSPQKFHSQSMQAYLQNLMSISFSCTSSLIMIQRIVVRPAARQRGARHNNLLQQPLG